jgi:hypothetical protein
MESNLDELFSELFAYRIMLQDSYENESDIIREIKNYLIEIGMSVNNIPQIIHDFYKTYGFEISLDVVNQACVNPIVNNILSFTISSEDFNNIYNNPLSNNNQIQEDSSNESSEDEQSDNLNESNNDLQQMASNLLNQQMASNIFNINNNSLNQQMASNIFNINNNSLNQQMAQNMFQYINFVNGNIQNHWISNPVNHSSLVNVINGLVNNGSSYQNVVVSMDDKELDNLKSVQLESNLDNNCSICMGQMEKGESVTNLVCSHTFHTDCIRPYLKEYNYKCPICRTELGKVKYSL